MIESLGHGVPTPKRPAKKKRPATSLGDLSVNLHSAQVGMLTDLALSLTFLMATIVLDERRRRANRAAWAPCQLVESGAKPT